MYRCEDVQISDVRFFGLMKLSYSNVVILSDSEGSIRDYGKRADKLKIRYFAIAQYDRGILCNTSLPSRWVEN